MLAGWHRRSVLSSRPRIACDWRRSSVRGTDRRSTSPVRDHVAWIGPGGVEGLLGAGERPLPRSPDASRAVRGQRRSSSSRPQTAAPRARPRASLWRIRPGAGPWSLAAGPGPHSHRWRARRRRRGRPTRTAHRTALVATDPWTTSSRSAACRFGSCRAHRPSRGGGDSRHLGEHAELALKSQFIRSTV